MTDRIEKRILLRAPRARVWRAICDGARFGAWLGAQLPAGDFRPGETVRGKITYPGYEHLTLEMTIVEVTPERRLLYRWHPNAVDPNHDYSEEATTLVTFELEDAPEGTLLTIVESGFDQIPLARRDEAFRGNEGGWTELAGTIADHVDATV